jgi:hypothetical protein
MEPTKRESQKAKLLQLLKSEVVQTNHELNQRIGYRYSARIHELRQDGHDIQTIKQTGDVNRGTVAYVLRDRS